MGFLEGTWIVQCPNGHRDVVDGITNDHSCDECGLATVGDGDANVLCRNGHVSWVSGVTEGHPCPNCGQECRLDDLPTGLSVLELIGTIATY